MGFRLPGGRLILANFFCSGIAVTRKAMTAAQKVGRR